MGEFECKIYYERKLLSIIFILKNLCPPQRYQRPGTLIPIFQSNVGQFLLRRLDSFSDFHLYLFSFISNPNKDE